MAVSMREERHGSSGNRKDGRQREGGGRGKRADVLWRRVHFARQLPMVVFSGLTVAVLLISAYRSWYETDGSAAGKADHYAVREAAAEVSAGRRTAGISSDVVPESDSGSEPPAEALPGESDEDALSDSWEEAKRVALTFDDGPHPVYTVNLLDGLAERGVCATFFVIGANIPGNEAVIERMDQEGHLIGNHTYDHVKISDLSVEEACEQVEKTSALVREITGKDTEYVRPPFGSWRKDLECPFEMFPVLWDVDPLDWTTKNTSDVVRRVLEAVEPDDIILLHDCYESSVEAALQIVDALSEQGYEFVTVDKLILE